MGCKTVQVKWTNGNEVFKDISLSLDEPPSVFKAQLFALTNVPPERQKIMLKGKLVGNEDEWNEKVIPLIKDKITLMLMGSADKIEEGPTEKVVFVEDMTDTERAKAYDAPMGLVNLGNTCYINATLQCLRAIPELQTALDNYSGSPGGFGGEPDVVQNLALLFNTLPKAVDTQLPALLFLNCVHQWQPRFAERGEQGGFQQQDANEFFVELLTELRSKLSIPGSEASDKKFIEQFMGIELETKVKCLESEAEPEKTDVEKELQLSCFINQTVSHVYSGLKGKLTETITKRSEILGREADYQKTSLINRLPGYLCVQLVRFAFKQNKGINAKQLRDVKFPLELDIYDMCTSDLQKKLDPCRAKLKEEDDKKALALRKKKAAGEPMDIDGQDGKVEFEPFSFEDDLGSSNSGKYTLTAVLTHQGRSSSSGHYIAWVRKADDYWFKCDDDKISAVTNDEVLKLSGGGDWHMGYLLFYKSRSPEIEKSS